ncbi:MAG: DUF2147 domain-containing protein [Methylococcaceae bacterium]
MKKTFMLAVVILMGIGKSYALPESALLGLWKNQSGDGLIEITKKQGKYSGTITGSPDKKDRKDKNNPDPKLQERSLRGVQIMGDLTYRSEDSWEDGWIYDPNNGKTYQCNVTLVDENTLEIRGYVGIALFGRTEVWKRNADKAIKSPIGAQQ